MRSQAILVFINLLVQLCPIAALHPEPIGIGAKSSGQEFILSGSLLPKDRLNLVAVVPITAEGETLGGIAAYDDVATGRPADYLVLYNSAGALLAVSWFDRFGIERLAVDRALVEEADNLAGVLVLLITGDFI